MIADTSKNGTYSVTLDEGDNYLTLEGNDFAARCRWLWNDCKSKNKSAKSLCYA